MGRSSGVHARSAITGKYISAAAAARHPRTTVVEHRGNTAAAAHSRSAVTGRYVTPATAKRSPNTTVTQHGR